MPITHSEVCRKSTNGVLYVSQIKSLRCQITRRYLALLRIENKANISQIENITVMEELKVLIDGIAHKHRSLPALLLEIQSQSLDKSQSKKLEGVHKRINLLLQDWSVVQKKHKKHQSACDRHTDKRGNISAERAVVWRQGLEMENIDGLETILAYFECQQIMYPPVAMGEQLREIWDRYDFQGRSLAIVQELSGLVA